jgi:hypothetical protein
MVEGVVELAARYAPAYRINITGGSAVLETFAGETVSIKAAQKAGKRFVNWTTTTAGVAFADANSETTTFTMPATAASITANFENVAPE